MGMVPKIFPPFPEREDIDLYAKLIPAKEVGGDLYDFFIEDAYENPIALYIENEGYNVYFNSSDFWVDLIKTIIPFITAIASSVVLFTKK